MGENRRAPKGLGVRKNIVDCVTSKLIYDKNDQMNYKWKGFL